MLVSSMLGGRGRSLVASVSFFGRDGLSVLALDKGRDLESQQTNSCPGDGFSASQLAVLKLHFGSWLLWGFSPGRFLARWTLNEVASR
jgi:hypothetical protein